jgi:diguanylate cyclase (GGDEF)-like protein
MNTLVRNTAQNLRLVQADGTSKAVPSKKVGNVHEHERRLLGKLQTTLDYEQLISFFTEETALVVDFDGMDYLQEEQGISIRSGKKTMHRCSYTLKVEGSHLGDIMFYRSKRFQETELKNIEILLSALVFPLKNALTYKEALDSAFTDPLTGAMNRAAMNQALIREIELAKRQDTPLSIILLDADHFKQINDTHGHSHGDEVLKTLAQIAKQTIRQSDVLYRFGGEEFMVLLGQTETSGATHLADRIREHIEALDTINGKKSDVTVSLGVTTLNGKDDCQSLFDRADKALYQAKSAGRNRTVTMLES